MHRSRLYYQKITRFKFITSQLNTAFSLGRNLNSQALNAKVFNTVHKRVRYPRLLSNNIFGDQP